MEKQKKKKIMKREIVDIEEEQAIKLDEHEMRKIEQIKW